MYIIRKTFNEISLFNSYAIGWIKKFMPNEYHKYKKFGI